ncbi:MAG: hypothetical protein AAB017_08255 [Nitrospirota bacterium]
MRKHFMLCVDNRGYESSLEIRKLYEMLTDRTAEKHHQVRVIDESGEDYLYPEKYIAPIRLPIGTKEKLVLATAYHFACADFVLLRGTVQLSHSLKSPKPLFYAKIQHGIY